MVNWYYVVGSDRVGPISEEMLKKLYSSQEINLDTYIWKKGFQNWERMRDVTDLNLDSSESESDSSEPQEFRLEESAQAESEELFTIEDGDLSSDNQASSPEVNFVFDWNSVREKSDLFYVRIGKDRKNFSGTEIYGPFSLAELREALEHKRVNFQTLIYAPGMSSWTKIEETPLNADHKVSSLGLSLNEVPLLLVFDHSPLSLVTLVKKAGVNDGVLLGSGPFSDFENKTVKATLYVGNELKIKNIEVKIHHYDKKDQSMECQFINLNSDAKKIMLNHVN